LRRSINHYCEGRSRLSHSKMKTDMIEQLNNLKKQPETDLWYWQLVWCYTIRSYARHFFAISCFSTRWLVHSYDRHHSIEYSILPDDRNIRLDTVMAEDFTPFHHIVHSMKKRRSLHPPFPLKIIKKNKKNKIKRSGQQPGMAGRSFGWDSKPWSGDVLKSRKPYPSDHSQTQVMLGVDIFNPAYTGQGMNHTQICTYGCRGTSAEHDERAVPTHDMSAGPKRSDAVQTRMRKLYRTKTEDCPENVG
jgi:hypothetical protein